MFLRDTRSSMCERLRDARCEIWEGRERDGDGSSLEDLDGTRLDTVSAAGGGRLIAGVDDEDVVAAESCEGSGQHET